MSRLRNNSLLIAAGLLALANAAQASETIRYHDDLVTVVDEEHFHLNVHTGDPSWLIVGHRRFRDIDGHEPYYVRVDGGRRMLFSTSRIGWFSDRHTLFLRDIRSGRTQQIDFSSEIWGKFLHEKSANLRDTVEQRPDGTLLLVSRLFDKRFEYVCSMEPFRLLSTKTFKGGKQVRNDQ
ncbi:MAG TPA: hypothetical protein VGO11_23335 [Chthoniobacteraceae bacterium]|jgi:hypothetical protein|nr:hypothetical protein [Chthoniobacteraceae bacterium]